jgi:hypothetical protein
LADSEQSATGFAFCCLRTTCDPAVQLEKPGAVGQWNQQRSVRTVPAEAVGYPGVLAYGAAGEEARAMAKALAQVVIAERAEKA